MVTKTSLIEFKKVHCQNACVIKRYDSDPKQIKKKKKQKHFIFCCLLGEVIEFGGISYKNKARESKKKNDSLYDLFIIIGWDSFLTKY